MKKTKINTYFKIFNLLTLTLVLTQCSKNNKVIFSKTVSTSVESTITTTNSGTVSAQQQAVLGFSASGRISKILIQAGDLVKKGQILAQLENNDLNAILGDAEREYNRAKDLFANQLISKVALDDSHRAVEIARSNFERSIIRAPFDGMTTEVNLELGELSNSISSSAAAKSPIRIVDMKPRIIKGEIDELDLVKVKLNAPARIKVPAVQHEAFHAKVSKVIPFVNTTKDKDRTSQIELQLNSSEIILPVGATAEIEIITEQKENVIAIPARTIQSKGGKNKEKWVFTIEDNHLAKKIINVGIGNYDKVEVLSGLSIGDKIAYPPENFELTDKLKVQPEEKNWP